VIEPRPALAARAEIVRGIPLTLAVRGAPGTSALLLVDLRHAHALLPQIDGAFLLTPAARVLGGRALGSDGAAAFVLTVPRGIGAEHELFFAQALTLPPAGRFQLSNVAVLDIRGGAPVR
jgi:hypothetical protein